MVRKYRADLGICLDGDGDRIVIIDSSGTILDGDKLIGILAKFLIETKQLGTHNEVVGTVMSNFGLEKYVQTLGGKFIRTKVGDRYIVERMLDQESVFGGEPSGHIIFKNFSTTGDGILAALKVIECMKYYNKPLVELSHEIPLVPQSLINVKVKEKKDFETLSKLQVAIKEVESDLKNAGRILLRYSGTEYLARVMVEGEDANLVLKSSQKIADILKQEIGA